MKIKHLQRQFVGVFYLAPVLGQVLNKKQYILLSTSCVFKEVSLILLKSLFKFKQRLQLCWSEFLGGGHGIVIPFIEVDNWMEKLQEEFDQLEWSIYKNDYSIPDYSSYIRKAQIIHI